MKALVKGKPEFYYLDPQILSQYVAQKIITPQAKKFFNVEDLLASSKIFIPVLVGDHWFLILIDIKNKTMYCLNSLESSGDSPSDLENGLMNSSLSMLELMREDIKKDQWKKKAIKGVPQQLNIIDCGVCVGFYADRLISGATHEQLKLYPNNQKSWDDRRKKIAIKLWNGAV